MPIEQSYYMRRFRVISLFLFLLLMTNFVSAQVSPLEALHSLQVFSGAMDAVTFSPDGSRLASGGRDNIIRVWDAETGELLMQTEGHADWVSTLTFSPGGLQIISGSRDNTVRLFNADTGALIAVIGGHDDDVSSVTISDDGTVIASGGRDGYIKFWDTSTGELIHEVTQFEQPVWHLAFDPAGNYLASASEDGTIWIWGLRDEMAGTLKQLNGHTAPVATFAFSSDGNLILSGGLDGTVRLWDVSDLSADTFEPIVTMSGHLSAVMGVGFSADSEVAISASLDGTVRLWDLSGAVEIGRELSVISGNGAPLTNLTLNPANTRAASVGTDGILNLWDMSAETIATVIESNQPVSITETTVVSNTETRAIPGVAIQESANIIATAIPPATINPPETLSVASPPPSNGRFLTLPSAGISIGVRTFPLDGTSWAIDPWEPLAGHLQGTSWVTGTGNVVVGGHSEHPDGSAGVFRNLYNVGIGDEIFMQDAGITRRYIVVNILSVDYRDLSVVYPTTFNRLTLFTCDIPSYVSEQGIYYERLVVIADEVPL